jgi:Mg-chelatase subunit ChlD
VKSFVLYPLSGILAMTALAVLAAEDKDQKTAVPAPEPTVNLEPRIRPSREPEDPAARRETSIRVETQLVLINVTVTDPMNRFVTGLEKEHFKLTEEKVEQTISQFSSEDAPLSVGLVFDASGSMNNKLSKSREAAAQLFKTANPEDEFFLVQFNNRPELVVGFTANTEEIQNRLTFTQAKGRTALLDGVYLAMNHMKKARNPRKAIIILSDGGDNSSRYTESEVRNLVREADVQVTRSVSLSPWGGVRDLRKKWRAPGFSMN